MEKISNQISAVGSSPAQISASGSSTAAAASPTTFVQADAATFRDLVQKLTGVSDDATAKLPLTVPSRHHSSSSSRPPSSCSRSSFKLHERRHNMRKLEIKLGLASLRPRHPSQPLLSPASSPVTPLSSDRLFSAPITASSSGDSPLPSPPVSEEDKAIAEKGFYLHPSPRSAEPPELLPLFPLRSPRQSD